MIVSEAVSTVTREGDEDVVRLVREPIADDEIGKREGDFVTDSDWDVLVGPSAARPVRVLKKSGDPLAIYVPRAVDPNVARAAFLVLRKLRTPVTNRGVAAGVRAERPIRADGRRSKTSEVDHRGNTRIRGVGSSIMGYMERTSPRFPMCRETAYNLKNPAEFEQALPLIRAADRAFREFLPERYDAQYQTKLRTHPAWTISDTAFTTVTVNYGFRTAIHKDQGDLKAGFGVMCALRAGHYEGGFTVFPEHRVAVDMRNGGILLADVHSWHGNTPIAGTPGKFERVSCVFYYREKMEGCLSPAEEIKRAASRKEGDPIWPKEEDAEEVQGVGEATPDETLSPQGES